MKAQHLFLRVHSIRERTTANGFYLKPPKWEVRASVRTGAGQGSLFYDVEDAAVLPKVGSILHLTIDDQTPMTEKIEDALSSLPVETIGSEDVASDSVERILHGPPSNPPPFIPDYP